MLSRYIIQSLMNKFVVFPRLSRGKRSDDIYGMWLHECDIVIKALVRILC